MIKIIKWLLLITLCLVDFLVPVITEAKNRSTILAMPKLYFYGPVDKITSKQEEIKIEVNYTSADINFNGYAKIKWQGTSSLGYDKKNYTIKLYEDSNLNNKLNVDFGWGKQNKYCLKANWVDKTHSRNVVTAKIASDVQKKYDILSEAPNNGLIDGFPVEVYLNDAFLGLYTMNIPKDRWLFNMSDNSKHTVLVGESYSPPVLFKNNIIDFGDFSVEVGEENADTLFAINRLIDFVKDSSDLEFKNEINNYFNLDSLLNYYIFMQVGQMYDNCAKNMLLVTYDQKIWYTSLYDLDSTWGTYWNGKNLYDYSIPLETDSVLWNRLKTNFSTELSERYFELRGNILTQENIMQYFYDFYNSISIDTWTKENDKWSNIPGYSLEQINDFLEVRLPIMDEYFIDMYHVEENMAGLCVKEKQHIVLKSILLTTNIHNDIQPTFYLNFELAWHDVFVFNKRNPFFVQK